ncbi:MAG: metallophosphoesterase [Bryobacteraceae bacterium]
MTRRRWFQALTAGLAGRIGGAAEDRDLGVVHAGNPVRAVAFGDFGYDGHDSGQRKVAEAIERRHRETRFHFGLTLGDNFYPRGVKSVHDPKWKEIWEADYGKLRIPFYATLGNHDYMGNEQAQVEYTARSESWKMPFRYYTFAAGPVRFFALDTDEGTAKHWFFQSAWSDRQAEWLDEQLAKHAAARWKIVYGHHPIFSDGHHGDEKRLQKKLLPILEKHKVDLYLCGHEHDLQHHESNGIDFVIAGGGGKDTRSVAARRARYAEGRHGFLEIKATEALVEARLTALDGSLLHGVKREKAGS